MDVLESGEGEGGMSRAGKGAGGRFFAARGLSPPRPHWKDGGGGGSGRERARGEKERGAYGSMFILFFSFFFLGNV